MDIASIGIILSRKQTAKAGFTLGFFFFVPLSLNLGHFYARNIKITKILSTVGHACTCKLCKPVYFIGAVPLRLFRLCKQTEPVKLLN